MKLSSFFKGLSLLVILNLLIKPVWILFIDRQVQNKIGNEAYGNYFALLNLSIVLVFIADAGLSNMLNQKIALTAKADISKLFRIKIFLLFIYSLVCLFVGLITHVSIEILIYVVAIQVLSSFLIFLRNIISSHQFFIVDAFLSVIDKLLMIFFCGAFLYTAFFGKISLIIFLQLQLACTAFSIAVAWIFVYYKDLFTKEDPESLLQIFKAVLPFAIIILLMSTHYRLDGFLLQQIRADGAYQAGIYASAYRLLDASNMVGFLAASFLVPFTARNSNDLFLVNKAVNSIRMGLFLIAIFIVSISFTFAPWIVKILYHSNDRFQGMVLKFCLASLPGYYLVHIYGSVLTALSKFRIFISILLISVLVNIILNTILIPTYGALGCCIAAISSQYFCGISSLIASSKTLRKKPLRSV